MWRGSGSAPRTFSRIVRLALLLGVECIFTPPYTPKANPLIESFNALWSSNFWLRHTFASVTEVENELPHKTIRATVDLAQQQLCVFHQPARLALPTTVACFAYPLQEAIVPVRPCFQRSHPPLWPLAS